MYSPYCPMLRRSSSFPDSERRYQRVHVSVPSYSAFPSLPRGGKTDFLASAAVIPERKACHATMGILEAICSVL
jgi:hypothetical protein